MYKRTIFISFGSWYWIGSVSSKSGENFPNHVVGKKVMSGIHFSHIKFSHWHTGLLKFMAAFQLRHAENSGEGGL